MKSTREVYKPEPEPKINKADDFKITVKEAAESCDSELKPYRTFRFNKHPLSKSTSITYSEAMNDYDMKISLKNRLP